MPEPSARPTTSFLNPYHHLPIPVQVPEGLPRSDVNKGLAKGGSVPKVDHLRHDLFGTDSDGNDLNSGRIVCRLTTVSPCVFGGTQDKPKGGGARVSPMMLALPPTKTAKGEPMMVPAITGSTLKGMISNLVEAASGSAFRVLNNTRLTVRSSVRAPRTAIGIVVERNVPSPNGRTRTERMLMPLTLPGLRDVRKGEPIDRDDETRVATEDALQIRNEGVAWEIYYRSLTVHRQSLPGYIHGYLSGKEGHKLDTYADDCTLGKFPPAGVSTLYRIPSTLPSFRFQVRDGRLAFVPCDDGPWESLLHHSSAQKDGTRGTPVSGRFMPPGKDPNLLDSVPAVLKAIVKPATGSIGLIRRLAMPDDIAAVENLTAPQGKKHETFIPLNNFLNEAGNGFVWDDPEAIRNELLYAEAAANEFEQNVQELQEFHGDKRPFRLHGDRADRVKLRHGDLVHFRLSEDFTESDKTGTRFQKVESISISSIWREDAGDIDTFMVLSKMEELLPMNANRKTVSEAEAMFGFVEDQPRGQRKEIREEETNEGSSEVVCPEYSPITALAGRIRFSPAWLDLSGSEIDSIDKAFLRWGDPYTLQILSSPKLPCPEMYFRSPREESNSRRIEKADLQRAYRAIDCLQVPEIQGRKIYLHRTSAIPIADEQPAEVWRTDRKKQTENTRQKALVEPLRPGQVFFFTIDFQNLTNRELNLLLFALRPFDDFRHKLGMGKPLGLGSICIDPQMLLHVDRKHRYRNQRKLLSSKSRFARATSSPANAVETWPDWLRDDREEAKRLVGKENPGTWQEFHGSPDVDPVVAHALKILGSIPPGESPDVHYPVEKPGPGATVDLESEHFKWFQNEDKRKAPTSTDDAAKQFLKPFTVETQLTDLELQMNTEPPRQKKK